MKQYIDEIELELLKHKRGAESQYEGLRRFNVAVPVQRKLIKKNNFSFHSFSNSQVLAIWDFAWNNSNCFEIMNLALYQYQYKALTKEEFDCIIKWTDQCICWQHSDDLSKIHADVVEAQSDWILPIFKSWTTSDNLWKRRQSIVGLIEYASKRKTFLSFEALISFVSPLLKDKEYYVQKGIGWTLREIYTVYPEQTEKFIKKNLDNISSTAYTAATKKLDSETKKQFKEYRKMKRKNKK